MGRYIYIYICDYIFLITHTHNDRNTPPALAPQPLHPPCLTCRLWGQQQGLGLGSAIWWSLVAIPIMYRFRHEFPSMRWKKRGRRERERYIYIYRERERQREKTLTERWREDETETKTTDTEREREREKYRGDEQTWIDQTDIEQPKEVKQGHTL